VTSGGVDSSVEIAVTAIGADGTVRQAEPVPMIGDTVKRGRGGEGENGVDLGLTDVHPWWVRPATPD
jgi:hypothetical protein